MSTDNTVTFILNNIGDMLTSGQQGQRDFEERAQGIAPEVRIPKQKQEKGQSSATDKGTKEETDEQNCKTEDRTDHAYADEGRVLRKKRKSTTADGASTCCTVCGVTVRPSELQSHYDWEVDKLNKLLRPDGTRYREARPAKEIRKSTRTKRKRDSAGNDDDAEADEKPLAPEERKHEFERIKNKRQERLYSRLRKNKRANLVDDDTPSTSSASEGDSTTCPICQIVLTGSAEERNSHAEACLVARTGATEEDEEVDIEGDEFDEYTWCGQTRVRAASLLETGYKGLGFKVGNQSTDVDTELNIESDDESAEFGPPQYGEADIIPCGSEEMDERTQTLRNAILEGSQERVPPLHQEDSNLNLIMAPIRRHSYTISMKRKIVEYAEAHSNRAAAREFDINESMVRRWRKDMPKFEMVSGEKKALRGGNPRLPKKERGNCEVNSNELNSRESPTELNSQQSSTELNSQPSSTVLNSQQSSTASSSSSGGGNKDYHSNPLYPEQSRTVLESLKAKIEELEEMVNKQNSSRCLICMESYKNATVSVQCWHVHCEECWLRTLGAKKLCPQCNMITSPNQLRRIYL